MCDCESLVMDKDNSNVFEGGENVGVSKRMLKQPLNKAKIYELSHKNIAEQSKCKIWSDSYCAFRLEI